MQEIQEDFLLSRKRIFSATVIVIIVTLLSKISGLVRDQIMAGYFGMSYDTDAYTWAFFIPNLFYILFAQSLIIAAFIPVYSSYIKEKTRQEVETFVSSVTNIMIIFFIINICGPFYLFTADRNASFKNCRQPARHWKICHNEPDNGVFSFNAQYFRADNRYFECA